MNPADLDDDALAAHMTTLNDAQLSDLIAAVDAVEVVSKARAIDLTRPLCRRQRLVPAVVGNGLPGLLCCRSQRRMLNLRHAVAHRLGAGIVDARSSGAGHATTLVATESLSRPLDQTYFRGYSKCIGTGTTNKETHHERSHRLPRQHRQDRRSEQHQHDRRPEDPLRPDDDRAPRHRPQGVQRPARRDDGLSAEGAAPRLRARAESYSRDADALRHLGMTDEALIYEAIRDELRKVAVEVETA